jgi:predicted dehydrogenase
MHKIKVGFIGAGAVGQMHISHWSKVPNCEVVALAELRPQLRNLVVDKFAIPQSYDSHAELIANPNIDAVVVVTRRHNTAAVVDSCLRAGKHVFSEKPMAKTADQANQLAQTANQMGLTYSIGYQRRHDAGTQIAKKKFDELMRTGELGKVTLVQTWNFTGQDRQLNASNSLMTKEERPSGLFWQQIPEWLPKQYEDAYDRFINVSCHDVNMLRYFFKQNPKVKFADISRKQGWVVIFDYGEFLSTFVGGVNELNDGGKPGEWDEGLEIIFEKGRLYIKFSPPLIHDICTRVELSKNGQEKDILCDGYNQTPAFELQAKNFLQSVIQKQKPLTSGFDAQEDLQTIQEIWQQFLQIPMS